MLAKLIKITPAPFEAFISLLAFIVCRLMVGNFMPVNELERNAVPGDELLNGQIKPRTSGHVYGFDHTRLIDIDFSECVFRLT